MMLKEITNDEIIFRNVVTQKESVMTYEDGNWYKPAEVIKETALATDKRPIRDKHFSERDIGYSTQPKFSKPYKRGKMLRDWHFDKKALTEEEVKQLLTGKKMDVSTHYKSKDIKVPGTFDSKPYDGINAQMDVEYFVWTDQGRCTEQDGCGLRRTDEADIKTTVRYDSISNECGNCGDDNMSTRTDQEPEKKQVPEKKDAKPSDKKAPAKGAEALKSCVAAKIKTIKKEGGKDQKQIIAQAMAQCRKKLGIKEPKEKE